MLGGRRAGERRELALGSCGDGSTGLCMSRMRLVGMGWEGEVLCSTGGRWVSGVEVAARLRLKSGQ